MARSPRRPPRPVASTRPGKILTFRAKESVEVRTGKSSATYFTVNGIDLGHMNDVGNPETWLFAPPDEPVRTDRR